MLHKKITNKVLSMILLLLGHFSYAQQIDIPEGVKYQKASDEINNKALELIKQEISNPTYALFEDVLYCGPQLWDRFVLVPKMSVIVKGNIKFKVPENGLLIEKMGKLIQNQKEFVLVWDQVVHDFKGTDYKIRKLTSTELQYFWAIIFYDIEEPLFIVENDKYSLIIDFSQTKLKLLFIEAI